MNKHWPKWIVLFALFGTLIGCNLQKNGASPQIGILHFGENADHLEIYTTDITGADLTHVMDIPLRTAAVLVNARIQLSPSGQLLAVAESEKTGVMPSNQWVTGTLSIIDLSTQESVIAATDIFGGSPSDMVWSPDNTMLTYCSYTEAEEEYAWPMRVYLASNSELVTLDTGDAQILCNQQVWSPDSRYLALAGLQSEVWVFEMPEGNLVWKSSLLDKLPGSTNYFCNLEWAPDSTRLAFTVGCSSLGIPAEPAPWYETYIADMESGQTPEAANIMQPEHSSLAWGSMRPHWSPDGQALLMFYTYKPPADLLGEENIPPQGIMQLNADGTKFIYDEDTIPLPAVADDEYFTWSENNNLAWLTSDNDWAFANFDESQLTLTPTDLELPVGCWPHWSPDGKVLVFTQIAACRGEADAPGVYSLILETGELVNVTESLGGDNIFLGWIPGG